MPQRYIAIIIIGVSTLLAAWNLDNSYFWDDEAYTAIAARNVLHTWSLTGWDGRNLIAVRNGGNLDERLRSLDPPLGSIVIAGFFAVFGESTAAGRLPSVVAGFATIVLLGVLARKLFGKGSPLWLYAMAMLGLSVNYLLYMRQCRYYALASFITIALAYVYMNALRKRRLMDHALVGILAALLFYTSPLFAAAILMTFASYHLAFQWRAFGKRDWAMAVGSVVLFALIIAPYMVSFKPWHRPDHNPQLKEVWYVQIPTLLWWNLRELNDITAMPWMVFAILLGLIAVRFRHDLVARRLTTAVIIAMFYIFWLAVFSPQAISGTYIADIRYLVPLWPVTALLIAGVLHYAHRWHPALAVVIAAGVVCTNAHSLAPTNPTLQTTLPAYIQEISSPYPTSSEATVAFLEKHAKQDDIVFVEPGYFCFPIQFYLGDKVHVGGLIYPNSPLPAEKIEQLPHWLKIEQVHPHWVISYSARPIILQILPYFSRPHEENGAVVQYEYEYVGPLNVFWFQTQRPELPWHAFTPKTDYDPQQGDVYVFQRVPVRPKPRMILPPILPGFDD